MTHRDPPLPTQPARRRALMQAASAGVLAATVPRLLFAQADDLAPYRSAKINWKQVDGESISVAVIPASYFDNLLSLLPQFQQLTGIQVRAEKVPPGQIRQKAMLDLSSRTTTYATHAADPMYYPLYVANKWVDPLDKYLNDPTLTDAGWYNYNDILKAWRDADSVDGKPYGIPYDGEVTVQVYRKDLYDAKGLYPADSYDQLLSNAKALHDPQNRIYGLAMRGFAGAGQNMYIYPSTRRRR
jgi:multiple sugar transport system substrate-binding protein